MHGAGASLAALVALTLLPVMAAPAAAQAPGAVSSSVAPGTTALYRMDEGPGATVMTDSGPGRHDAPIDPAGVQSGATHDGATAYNWVRRAPEAYPASPERIIQVPDHVDLEPGTSPTFTIELRYRTKESFGNITQKGQATSRGGQWKIQSPKGIPSCLFQGADGQVATGSLTPLNDDQWHNLTCVLTPTGVTMYVDGELRNRKNGVTGTIDNDIPLTIGGKINCDQIAVTCDYFSGQIDHLRLSKAANLAPSAAYTSGCSVLTCSFDASGSTDPDGSLTRYLWEFGDGTTSTEAAPRHAYSGPGSYTARLTVTDNQAAVARSTQTVVVDGQGPVSPVVPTGSAVAAGSSKNPTVAVPADAKVGDRLVLLLSHNNTLRTVGSPTGVGTFSPLGAVTAETMASFAWSTLVRDGDQGRPVTVPLNAIAKYTLTAATYSGVAAGALPAASLVDLSETASRRTPTVNAPQGAWALSYWADRSGTTTAWTADPSVTTRSAGCAADGGRICSALADTGAGLPPGPYGSIPASTGIASDEAVMWTIVLPPVGDGPVDEAPVASFAAPTCTFLVCSFDGSASTDAEGQIASYEWTFGEGAPASGATADHAFAAAGSYQVTLTVTDSAGQTRSAARTVVVQGEPPASAVAFVGADARQSATKNPVAAVPAATVAGDRLVLLLSRNNLTRTVGDPTGVADWTLVDSVTAGSLGTTVWTKVATAADAGHIVTVPLSGAAKSTLTVGAWSGVSSTPGITFARSVDLASRTARTTPSVSAPAGAWVASYWADRSSTTTRWTASAATERVGVCANDAGRVCSLLADTGGPVAAGTHPGVVASTDVASKEATMWSLVLAP